MTNPKATFETTLGTFTAEIFADVMPATSRNFLKLARSGFYDGLHFHRVIRGFMAQFGCPYSSDAYSPEAGTGQAPHGNIPDEFPPGVRLSNEPLTLSMANAGRPDSGSCQFFINTAHNVELDWFSPGPSRHPVFGRVIAGADVVRRIDLTPVTDGTRPRPPIKVTRVVVEESDVPVEAPPPVRASSARPAPAAAPPKRAAPGSDPWTILGVRRGASADDVRKAFEDRRRDFEPAKLAGLSLKDRKAAEDELRRVTVAFEIIGS